MKNVIIALLVLAACGTTVFAGEFKNNGSVLLGYSMPTGKTADTVKGGVALGAEYDGYKINDMLSIGAGFYYTNGDIKAATKYSITTWGIAPFAKYSKEVDLAGKKMNAYGLVGLGVYNVSDDVPSPSDINYTKFGFNLGGGIMYPLADKMELGLDVRYHYVATPTDSTNYFIPSLKFSYSF